MFRVQKMFVDKISKWFCMVLRGEARQQCFSTKQPKSKSKIKKYLNNIENHKNRIIRRPLGVYRRVGSFFLPPPIVLPLEPRKPHLAPTPPPAETYSRDSGSSKNGGPFFNIFLVPFWYWKICENGEAKTWFGYSQWYTGDTLEGTLIYLWFLIILC